MFELDAVELFLEGDGEVKSHLLFDLRSLLDFLILNGVCVEVRESGKSFKPAVLNEVEMFEIDDERKSENGTLFDLFKFDGVSFSEFLELSGEGEEKS